MIIPDRTILNKGVEKWNAMKKQSQNVALRMVQGAGRAADRVSWLERGYRMSQCADRIEYNYCPECHNIHLARTWLCRDRLCPLCAWRLSLKRTAEMLTTIEHLVKNGRVLHSVMATLTVRNVPSDQLCQTIDDMLKGWQLFTKRRKVKRHMIGYARSLEITFNAKERTWHPHLHVLILLDHPWHPTTSVSISFEDFGQFWQESMRTDYTPVIDVRKTYAKYPCEAISDVEKLIAATAEALKYAIKPGFIISLNPDELVTLGQAVKGRRLVTYGGLIKEARKFLRLSDDDAPDDVGDADISCPACGNRCMPVAYEWAINSYLIKPGSVRP